MKNITGKTLIFYTVQQSHNRMAPSYNITTFKKSAPQEPKIRDVLYELPLDYQYGNYHFRFKSEFFQSDEKIIGWIDISNLLAKVPIVGGNIYVKVLRLPGDQENKLFNKEKLKAIGLLDPKGNSPFKAPSNTNIQTKPPTNGLAPSKDLSANKGGDILDLNQSPKRAPPATNINTNTSTEPNNKNSSAQKNTKSNSSTQKPFIPGSETPEQRLQGFKNQIKNCKKKQSYSTNKNQQYLISYLSQQWGYSGHKTINNLTTLLATLHQIWPQWQAVSLSDMLRPEDVGAVYKRAVVRLHPDKNQNKDYQTKYLAKRIFELLNQAKKAATAQSSGSV